MAQNFVFGPVTSRRLGRSLGIDPIPLKTCNWNCVYCQLGRTVPLSNERRSFYPRQEIHDQIEAYLENSNSAKIDWITIVGSGEPTLCLDLGWLIHKVKKLTSIPVAVLTNGALLFQEDVRNELVYADAVLPSLDASNPKIYRRLNRPHPDLDFERVLMGLRNFRQEYHGNLWLEVMLVAGLNDSDELLVELSDTIDDIRPDQVHINSPSRPPAETWVHPPDQQRMNYARQVLGETSWIVPEAIQHIQISNQQNIETLILDIITRHPMQTEDLAKILENHSRDEVIDALQRLERSGTAQIVDRYGKRFWSSAGARYANEH